MKLWPFARSGETRETKASAAGAAIAAWFVGQPVWTPRNYAALSDEAYVRNAVAFRCVKLIASSAAAVPWLLTGRDRKEIDQHPLLDLLNRPAPMIGGHSLFEAFYAYILLAGTSYLEGVGPDGKPPKELWSLRPDRTKVIPASTGRPGGFEYEANGVRLRWEVDPFTGQGPVLQVKEFHPLNDWYGLSRVEPAAYAIDRHNAASAHNKALLDNGARPSGALVFQPVKGADGSEQSAPEPVIKAAEKMLADKSGPQNAGRGWVFGGNVKWEEMGISPKDMDFAASKDDAARDICTSFGVPHILIVPGQSTYNNVREAKLELWEDTILPLIDKAVDSLDAWLSPQFGEGIKLGVNLDEVSALEPRRESKRKSVVELFTAGLIDDTEAREALQYGPRPDEAVRLNRGDGQVLASLIDGATKEEALAKPLYRYLLSVGLLEATDTFEDFLAGWSSGALTADDLLATDGPGGATGVQPVVDPATEGGNADAAAA